MGESTVPIGSPEPVVRVPRGSVLCDHTIRRLAQAAPPLISGYLRFEQQLQPGGFDVTVRSISRPAGSAYLRSDRGGRTTSTTARCEDLPATSRGVVSLAPGFYLFQLNETFALPSNVAALAHPRATLLRCGATVNSGLWDPGFQGTGVLGVHVHNPQGLGLSLGTTFAQVTFHQMDGTSEGFGADRPSEVGPAAPDVACFEIVATNVEPLSVDVGELLRYASDHGLDSAIAASEPTVKADAAAILSILITGALNPLTLRQLRLMLSAWLDRPRSIDIEVRIIEGPPSATTTVAKTELHLDGVRPSEAADVVGQVMSSLDAYRPPDELDGT